MQFSRLRVSGFKSFVDPTELYIEPGLTGIVGPNGCGKSNIVEALRWVMGETSAKQMRGGEMDDIIFAGTTERPARNISEVVLTIDNSDRNAPSQFNDTQELDVARRIERGSGSAYRINGREVRARDVQTLFADAASGARSNSMVSQGRVGAIIAAKATDRRQLLEEAAGITGLHSRRHEAELRLRAAESNLERLEDVINSLEEQYRGLKRQARQASRYRNLSGHIRNAEAVVLYHRWTAATAAYEQARAALAETEERVAEVTREVGVATTAQAEAAAAVPGLRQHEAEAAAGLQRLMVARDTLEREEQRLNEMRRDLEARLAQIDSDTEREEALRGDAVAAIARLEAETADIRTAQTNEQTETDAAHRALEESETEVADFEQKVTDATQQAATDEARQANLTRQIADQEQRHRRLTVRLEEIAAQLRDAEATAADRAAMEQTRIAAGEARVKLDQAREQLEQAEAARTAAQQDAERAREALQARSAETGKFKAEEDALSALLQIDDPDLWPPMIDALEVDPGFEISLGAALGDDLVAPSDESAPIHWRSLAPYDSPAALPDGVVPLSRHVRAPVALARRLSQIGLVADDAEGERLRPLLAQGQRLVSKAGSLWRWDGLTAAAGAPTAATRRLEQRNRLVDIVAERQAAETVEADAQGRFDTAHEKAQATLAAERAARDATWSSDRAYQEARDAETAAAQRAANAQSRLESLAESQTGLRSDLSELETMLDASRAELATFAGLPERREALNRQRGELAERRRVLLERQGNCDRLRRDAEARRARLGAIDADVQSWRARAKNAEDQMAQLAERRGSIAEEAARLDARPAEIAQQRAQLFEQIEQAEAKRDSAADALAQAETRLEEAGATLRGKEARLAETREERIRRESGVEQANQTRDTITERVRERLQCAPDGILASADIAEDADLQPLDIMESKLERLTRERDNMGPVNLRAEMEAEELNEKITTTQGERDDLIAAISKLRQGIAGLNREGRERLLAAFTQVDSYFQELFQKLFGGGRAHLSLTEAEDPLDAGLEIMASPPGKRLQNMSLLSGGEQAMTAISLLFAVFMTNPAPICVLDEVDAPLDDNNVDRFCAMLDDISERTSTRFLLITHHRLTMARMDRLYGVTMPERGVSQLVSVDLGAADRIRDTA